MLKDRQAEDKVGGKKEKLIFAFLACSYQALSKIEFDNYSQTGGLIMGLALMFVKNINPCLILFRIELINSSAKVRVRLLEISLCLVFRYIP